MPKFSYRAVNEDGKTIYGVIEAESVDLANIILNDRGHIPTKIREEKYTSFSTTRLNVLGKAAALKQAELIIFTKQLATMLRAGVPMIKLLTTLKRQTDNKRLRKIVHSMILDMTKGSTFYEAFGKHPETFSGLYCNMVRAGEASGKLPDILERLLYILEHEHKLKADVKSALNYPIMVVAFLVISFFILLTVVIPKFINIFQREGLDLPLPTRICILMYESVSDYWYLLLTAAVAGILILIHGLKNKSVRYFFDAYSLRLPILGPILVKTIMSRFTSVFALLHSSGLHIIECMKILSGTLGNSAVSEELDHVRDRMQEGQGISEPLMQAKFITPMVINMAAVGEESGNLDEMFHEVSKHYDSEVDYAVKGLSEAITPILTVGLAAVVGFFALAIFMPMWDMFNIAK